ncbi:transcription-repair coupling factor [Bengtsoniella intestinalis]|uniref:transcription-repair coupling factor n=1 Tax=Bengtsoniella intestinalis TaxID=3073143 RepID=UPI00391F14E9
MKPLLSALATLPQVAEVISHVERGECPVAMTGLQGVHRASIGATIATSCDRPAVFVCADEGDMSALQGDLQTLYGIEPTVLHSRDWQLRPHATSSHGWEHHRLATLYALSQDAPQVVVTTVDALTMITLSPDLLKDSAFTITVGDRLPLDTLPKRLVAAGYTRCDQVEGVGQFALRGGILDIFSPMMERPIRCEFFDNDVDACGTFDPATQRRMENINTALILPASEVLLASGDKGIDGLAQQMEALAESLCKRPKRAALVQTLRNEATELRNGIHPSGVDRYLAAIYPEQTTAIDYLPPDALVFFSESARIDQRLEHGDQLHTQDLEPLLQSGFMAGEWGQIALPRQDFLTRLEDFPLVMLDALPTSRHPYPPKALLSIQAQQLSSYGGSLETAVGEMEQYRQRKSRILVLCGGEVRGVNLHHLLQDRGIPATLDLNGTSLPAEGEIRIAIGALSAGSEYPQLNLAVLTEGQLLAPSQKKFRQKKDPRHKKINVFTDLTHGDLVVHIHHGIGRFVGVEPMLTDGVKKDYIKIDYAGGDALYVPATQLDNVSKYIGGGEDKERTKLHRLGGAEWGKQKLKAKSAAKDLAKGLIELYAQRQRQPGFAFSPDSPWQQEFEASFDYAETDDQLTAIAQIKADMETPRPMDRLLCGDVGFGKTEVAFRGAMKAILDGKQVAMLAPTTVLCQQHYATAMSRFRSFPVTIEVLSRYTKPKDVKRILQALKDGRIDFLIGTHKLLGKALEFKDLGLLIIDEEQRFGVSHKERLKEMSRQVDVLTLSATPIPRTLNMAMSGLRDMSTLEQPPHNRQVVQTYVLEHDWHMAADACRREIARGGQVYYLHNRVETLALTAMRLQKLLGEDVSVVMGHGKMSETELSSVMQAMVEGEAQVFVCTTIIETGIDIPNANTLIIENADRMGLAQLHQLRGRIGRSSRRAYAYLTFQKGKVLEETAARRLSAIREYVEFGAGFQIAMRDLEIRGAGNLLGPEQSGYLMSVGYDLYLKLLEEAVLEEKGEKNSTSSECLVELNVNANIPDWYVESGQQRMDLYRRIAGIRGNDDASEVLDELLDRYGDAPKSVLALLDVALLRGAGCRGDIGEISQKEGQLHLKLAVLHLDAVLAVCNMKKYRQRLRLPAGDSPVLVLTLRPKENILEIALELAEDLCAAIGNSAEAIVAQ